MTETLNTLSLLQQAAMAQGISFTLDAYSKENRIPGARVNLTYTQTGGVSKGYALTTTFSENMQSTVRDKRLNDIRYFIATVKGPNN